MEVLNNAIILKWFVKGFGDRNYKSLCNSVNQIP